MTSTGFVRFLCASVMLMVLSGCIKSPLKSNLRLKPLESEQTDSEKMNNSGITVRAHQLSKQACKNLLGIAIKHTNVIQVTVTNRTCVDYELKKSDINADLLPIHMVTQEIKDRNKVIRNVGIAGTCWYFAGPATLFGMMSVWAFAAAPLGIALIPLGIAGAFVGAGVATGKCVSKQRKKVAVSIHETLRTLSPDILRIAPSSTESMLLFVDESITPDELTLSMCSPATQQYQTVTAPVTV